jgi:hypothetical protein
MHIISLTVRKKMKMKKTTNKELKREKKEEAVRGTTKEQQQQDKLQEARNVPALSLSLSLSLPNLTSSQTPPQQVSWRWISQSS